MSLRYIYRVAEQPRDYIENNYDIDSLTRYIDEIQKAREELKELEAKIGEQFNQVTRITEYIVVRATRYKDDYGDKKVYIIVKAHKIKMIDGLTVDDRGIYQTSKQFGYREQEEAKAHAKELLNKYPGSKYYNETPYKTMFI